MGPIDYTIDVQNPFDSAMKGMGQMAQIAQVMQAAKQQEADALARKQLQTDLATLANNPNAGAKDFASIAVRYPQLTEHFKQSWGMLNEAQQKAQLGQATQVYSALEAEKPDIAANLLREQASAYRNSGDEEKAKSHEMMAKLVELNPGQAKRSVGLMLASNMGPEKFEATFAQLAGQDRLDEQQPGVLKKTNADADKAEAEATKATAEANATPQRLALEERMTAAQIRSIDSQIRERSARLGLDRDRLQTETELKLYELNLDKNKLGDDGRKIVNEAVTSSVTATQSAEQMLNLAQDLEKAGGGYGAFSSFGEWWKNATGNQNAMSGLRQEYTRLRNMQAIKMLPPGPATDRDISLALKGFPAENADTREIAGFLRGMAKLNQYAAVTDEAKAEWVNSVGHLGRARGDLEVMGVKVPAGMTFANFASQVIKRKADELGKQQAADTTTGRGYMRYATGE